jgi:hypothetical protein
MQRRLICAIGLLVGLAGGCSPRPAPPEAPKPEPAAVAPVPTPPPPVVPTLARADLLAAAADTASAYAGAAAYPDTVAALASRRFLIRVPITCGGQARPGARIETNLKTGVVKLSVRPTLAATDAPLSGLVAETDAEAADGFWLSWPWLRSDGCPKVAASPAAAVAPATPAADGSAAPKPVASKPVAPKPAAPETVGLAELFEKGGSRLQRRSDQGYVATLKPEGANALSSGVWLELEGRVADPADHRPVRCAGDNPDRKPVCLILVKIERAALVNGAGDVLADWS